jgi:hypothetical protein
LLTLAIVFVTHHEGGRQVLPSAQAQFTSLCLHSLLEVSERSRLSARAVKPLLQTWRLCSSLASLRRLEHKVVI